MLHDGTYWNMLLKFMLIVKCLLNVELRQNGT